MRLPPPSVLLATLSLAVGAQAPLPSQAGWDGEWKLLPRESDQVGALIEEHLKGRSFAAKLLWKRKLTAACRTYPNLDLLFGSQFRVTFGRELPADTPADGSRGTWSRSDGERFQVFLRQEEGRLVQTLQGKGYTLTHAYTLDKGSRDLELRVTYANPRLEPPFSYRMVYRKVE